MFPYKLMLVSSDPVTRWDVHEYLTRTGAALSSASRLESALDEAEGADAIVVLADDYPSDEVAKTVTRLSAKLVVVITGRPEEFTALERRSSAPPLVVLPRPTWGWMLLDAVRSGMKDHEAR